jgi:hypothetical protein
MIGQELQTRLSLTDVKCDSLGTKRGRPLGGELDRLFVTENPNRFLKLLDLERLF